MLVSLNPWLSEPQSKKAELAAFFFASRRKSQDMHLLNSSRPWITSSSHLTPCSSALLLTPFSSGLPKCEWHRCVRISCRDGTAAIESWPSVWQIDSPPCPLIELVPKPLTYPKMNISPAVLRQGSFFQQIFFEHSHGTDLLLGAGVTGWARSQDHTFLREKLHCCRHSVWVLSTISLLSQSLLWCLDIQSHFLFPLF